MRLIERVGFYCLTVATGITIILLIGLLVLLDKRSSYGKFKRNL